MINFRWLNKARPLACDRVLPKMIAILNIVGPPDIFIDSNEYKMIV